MACEKPGSGVAVGLSTGQARCYLSAMKFMFKSSFFLG